MYHILSLAYSSPRNDIAQEFEVSSINRAKIPPPPKKKKPQALYLKKKWGVCGILALFMEETSNSCGYSIKTMHKVPFGGSEHIWRYGNSWGGESETVGVRKHWGCKF